MVLNRFYRFAGPLRMAIVALSALCVLAVPFMHDTVGQSGWLFVLGIIAPTFALTLIFVIPLDMAMTGVFMSDKRGDERVRFRRILVMEAVTLVLLLVTWLPIIGSFIGIRSPSL